MLVTALAADHNRNSSPLVVPDETFQLLCDSASTFYNFTWIYGANKEEFPIIALIDASYAEATAGSCGWTRTVNLLLCSVMSTSKIVFMSPPLGDIPMVVIHA